MIVVTIRLTDFIAIRQPKLHGLYIYEQQCNEDSIISLLLLRFLRRRNALPFVGIAKSAGTTRRTLNGQ